VTFSRIPWAKHANQKEHYVDAGKQREWRASPQTSLHNSIRTASMQHKVPGRKVMVGSNASGQLSVYPPHLHNRELVSVRSGMGSAFLEG